MENNKLKEISMHHEMPKFQSSSTYQGTEGEVITGPSMTKPDMTYSISEILARYASGMPLTQLNGLEYTGDVELPNLRAMDFVDRDELVRSNQNKIEEMKKRIETMRNKASAKAKESTERRRKLDDAFDKLVAMQTSDVTKGQSMASDSDERSGERYKAI